MAETRKIKAAGEPLKGSPAAKLRAKAQLPKAAPGDTKSKSKAGDESLKGSSPAKIDDDVPSVLGGRVQSWHHALHQVSGALSGKLTSRALSRSELRSWAEKLFSIAEDMRDLANADIPKE